MYNSPWSLEELNCLLICAREGISKKSVSHYLGRSLQSIAKICIRYRVKFPHQARTYDVQENLGEYLKSLEIDAGINTIPPKKSTLKKAPRLGFLRDRKKIAESQLWIEFPEVIERLSELGESVQEELGHYRCLSYPLPLTKSQLLLKLNRIRATLGEAPFYVLDITDGENV
jgi:hypothetical protein